MSKYTTQVRFIIEQATLENVDKSIFERTKLAAPKIFDFDYPIWDENYRNTLETKILAHYFNREVGFETVGLWKYYLWEKMNLIMPYYIDLHETIENEYDYLTDIDYTETFEENRNKTEDKNENTTSDATTSGTNNATSTDGLTENGTENRTGELNKLVSDTPQANYNNLDYATNLEKTDNTDAATKTNTSNRNTTDAEEFESTNNVTADKVIKNQTGEINEYKINKNGNLNNSKTKLMMEYRESLLNIDKMIIDDLSDLFMLIY